MRRRESCGAANSVIGQCTHWRHARDSVKARVVTWPSLFLRSSMENSDPIICPYCHKDVFEFGSDNYCYDRELAKTRGEEGNYVVHRDCYLKAHKDEEPVTSENS